MSYQLLINCNTIQYHGKRILAMVSRISGSVEEVFKKFDTDKSGQIDAAELKTVFDLLHCENDDVSD